MISYFNKLIQLTKGPAFYSKIFLGKRRRGGDQLKKDVFDQSGCCGQDVAGKKDVAVVV